MMEFLAGRKESLGHALRGLRYVLATQRNAQLAAAAAVAIAGLGALCRLAAWEWVAVVLTISHVLSPEALNTGIERVGDRCAQSSHDPLVCQSKDSAAAGVLLPVLASIVVGGIIFLPRLIGFIRCG